MSMLFEKKTNELFLNCYDVGDMLRQETHSVSPTVSKPHSLSPTVLNSPTLSVS